MIQSKENPNTEEDDTTTEGAIKALVLLLKADTTRKQSVSASSAQSLAVSAPVEAELTRELAEDRERLKIQDSFLTCKYFLVGNLNAENQIHKYE